MHYSINKNKAFTVLELLIVIGILAILAVAVILVLRPVEFLRQARDAKRINDLGVINSAISLTLVTSGGSVDWDGLLYANTCYGESNQKVYTSVPVDNGETPPTLPSGWSWAQVSSTDLYRIDGYGWIPINFGVGGAGLGAKFPVLPIDPTNTFASGHYFTYVCDPELNAVLESEKMKPFQLTDGGDDDNAYEIGNKLYITPTSDINSGNLAFNHSFEIGWREWGTQGRNQEEETVDETSGYDGNFSARLHDASVASSIYQDVSASAGQNYDLSFAIKYSALASQAEVRINWLDSGGATIGIFNQTGMPNSGTNLTWQSIQSTVSAPTNTVKARINLILNTNSGSGTIWFDKISFKGPVPLQTELVQNGSFETDWIDWGNEETPDSTTAHDGITSFKITDRATYTGLLYQYVPVTANSNYTLSYAVKYSNLAANQAHVFIEWLDSGSGLIQSFDHLDLSGKSGTDTAWQILQAAVTAPPSAVRARIKLQLNMGGPSGTIWFDSVSFE